MKTPRILLTVGDVNGIGPEVMLKSLALLDGELDYRPTIVGAPSALAETIDLLYPGEMKVIDRTLHFGSSTIPITRCPSDSEPGYHLGERREACRARNLYCHQIAARRRS